nr:pilus assembly protein PilM [candidate division Zixibacteria bacterium]
MTTVDIQNKTGMAIQSSGNKTGSINIRTDWKKQIRFGRTITIFLDNNALQLATAKHYGYRSCILDVNKIYIPQTPVSEDDRRRFLGEEINRYIKTHKGILTNYVLGVGGSESAFRLITLPRMKQKELNEALFWEGSKRIPFGLENAYYGFNIIERRKTDLGEDFSCALIAVLKEEIDQKLDIIEPLDLNPNAAYHELEAIGHMLPHTADFDPGRTYALINIKKQKSVISFYRGRYLEFMHICSVGSDTLSGGPATPTTYEYFTESLVTEIQNSLDYYVGQFSNTSADKVYIYGDLSYSTELIENLSDRFGIEFRRFPLEGWSGIHPVLADRYEQIPVSLSAVAMSLAEYNLIDFLPPAIREQKVNRKFAALMIPVFIVITAFLMAIWSGLKLQTDIENYKLRAQNEQVETFRNSAVYNMYNQIKLQMSADNDLLKKLKSEPTILHLNMKELSRLLPQGIKLNLYDLQDGDSRKTLVISGQTLSADPPPEVVLAEFIARLESSPFYNNITLQRHSKQPRGDRFAIDFQIEMDAVL